jgi:hypothetical protein
MAITTDIKSIDTFKKAELLQLVTEIIEKLH